MPNNRLGNYRADSFSHRLQVGTRQLVERRTFFGPPPRWSVISFVRSAATCSGSSANRRAKRLRRNLISQAAYYLALALLLASAGGLVFVGVGYSRQEAALSRIAATYRTPGTPTVDVILAQNDYVSRLDNYEENSARFLGVMGPTPLDVIENGGWCSDRSLLLAALLNKSGIPAHTVMLRPCHTCPPNHTVVEAFTGDFWMAVDPTYGLVYPKTDGTYASIEDLREDSELVHNTLLGYQKANGRVASYDPHRYSYEYPLRLNFDRDPLTRLLGRGLTLFGERLEMIRRPQLLERPRLFVLIGLAATTALALLACFIFGYQVRFTVEPQSSPLSDT